MKPNLKTIDWSQVESVESVGTKENAVTVTLKNGMEAVYEMTAAEIVEFLRTWADLEPT